VQYSVRCWAGCHFCPMALLIVPLLTIYSYCDVRFPRP
jgi:hypothetical protein